MATTHISFNASSRYGSMLRNVLNHLEAALDVGNDLLAIVPHMIDGDGSAPAHFDLVTSSFGFNANADAKAFWDELQSLFGKLNTDSSVSSVNAAIKQAIAKMG